MDDKDKRLLFSSLLDNYELTSSRPDDTTVGGNSNLPARVALGQQAFVEMSTPAPQGPGTIGYSKGRYRSRM
jgi:hypothetical protein